MPRCSAANGRDQIRRTRPPATCCLFCVCTARCSPYLFITVTRGTTSDLLRKHRLRNIELVSKPNLCTKRPIKIPHLLSESCFPARISESVFYINDFLKRPLHPHLYLSNLFTKACRLYLEPVTELSAFDRRLFPKWKGCLLRHGCRWLQLPSASSFLSWKWIFRISGVINIWSEYGASSSFQ